MDRMPDLLRKLRFFLHRDRLEQDLAEEMRHHLAMKSAEAGDPATAYRRFGNVTSLKEESRAMWTWTFWEQFVQDVRYGLRMMTANPLFTAMAVLSLALGIGANTAIYSFMDAIMMRALPVPHPEQLAIIEWRANDFPVVIHSQSGTRYKGPRGATSPDYPFAAFDLFRADSDIFSTVFAYAWGGRRNTVVQGQAEMLNAELVSGGYFGGLGVYPAAGRLILADDDRFGAPPVAVVSYAYAQRRFGSSSAAVGQSILIDRTPFIIAGVSPPDFFGVDPGFAPELMLPLHAGPLLAPKPDQYRKRFVDNNFYWVDMMGRLRPGVSIQQAEARLKGQFHEFVSSTAATAKEKTGMPELWLDEGGSGLDSLRRQYSKPVYVLMAMVGLILVIACANIANLLLARATGRRREIAVRLSLGAGRFRVVRQLLTESVLLSAAGGALGVLVAGWGIRSITWLLANGRDNFTLHAGLNWPVLGFTFTLAVVCGLLFGLAPALQGTRVDLTPALKETRASAPRGRRRAGIRIGLSHVLVVSQIALSLLLVVAAGLFVRTLSNLHSVALGFNRENVLLFNVNARQAGYKGAALARFYGNLRDRFRTIAGVRNVSFSNSTLAALHWDSEGLYVPGLVKTGNEKLSACEVDVDQAFLSTMQIPILMGREIGERDLESARVAVVNEEFVKKYFAGENPIGRRIGIGDSKSPADIEIVGVAKNSLYNSIKETDTPPVAYVPYTQDLDRLSQVSFELRAAGDPLALVNTVRQIVLQASPAVPVSDVTTQSRAIEQTISQERTFAGLCGCFAVLALLIACVGLYGSVAYTVARRTGEIGIRMALGAEGGRIIWMVLREVVTLAAAGLGIGLAAAYGLTRFVASFLFGMKPHDPVALSLSVLVLVAAAILAGYAPARRASRIDPMAALRHE